MLFNIMANLVNSISSVLFIQVHGKRIGESKSKRTSELKRRMPNTWFKSNQTKKFLLFSWWLALQLGFTCCIVCNSYFCEEKVNDIDTASFVFLTPVSFLLLFSVISGDVHWPYKALHCILRHRVSGFAACP